MTRKAARLDRRILFPRHTRLPDELRADYDRVRHSHDLLMRADEFIQAAHDLPPTVPTEWPRYFLLGQAAELGMKAFLAHWGPLSSKDLQGFGHDLARLLAVCTGPGLALEVSEQTREVVLALNVVHRHQWARYPSGLATHVYAPKGLLPDIDALLDAVRVRLRGNATRFAF